MRCPLLKELPDPPDGKAGWPWAEESHQLPDSMPNGREWPKISMVTPSYNQVKFVEETIRAVLLQGYPNLEYIISEDCSTDNSLEVIRKYEKWVNILIANENGGMSRAINRGFEVAEGDIITWIATDDVYSPEAFRKIAEQWHEIKSYGAVVGAFQFMDEESHIETKVNRPILRDNGPIDLSLELSGWRLHQVATFYLKDALDNVGKYVREDLRHNMDRELIYRIAQRHKVYCLDDTLAYFRRHQKSKSGSVSNIITMAKEYAEIQNLFMTDNGRENAIRKEIYRFRIANGYLKFSKYCEKLSESVASLLTVLRYYPKFICHRGYFIAWGKLLKSTIVRRKTKL